MRKNINPILHGGGSSWPPPGGISRVTPQWTLRLSSYFMTLFLSTFIMSHWGHFSKKNFENLKNRKNVFRPLRHQRVPPLKKNFWKLFFSNFFVTNHTFSTWIWILHVLSFLLMYITWVLVKISNFRFFTIEFLSITKFFPWPLMARIIIKKVCFWYVWTGKDQNFVLRTIFCHFNANWLSQRAFSQGGSAGPPPVITYILDPV